MMMDKCAPRPWTRAQSQPPRGEKIKSIFLILILCDHLAHRHIPDSYTKWTRTPNVIYPPLAIPRKTHINGKQHHNTLFFNTTAWDFHPHASPEGPGTAPSEKCQRRSFARPLGAAMRLTASRQSPKDTPRPRNSRQMKLKPINHYRYTENLLYCEHNSTEQEKCGRDGQYTAAQSADVLAPQTTQHLP